MNNIFTNKMIYDTLEDLKQNKNLTSCDMGEFPQHQS
jgi:hypothetical protein